MVLQSKIDLELAEKFWFKDSKFKMLGVFWKIQEIFSKMVTRILKIDLEMAEIIDPKVDNPLKKETKLWSYRVPINYCLKVYSSEGHKNGANQILILCMFFSTSGHLV